MNINTSVKAYAKINLYLETGAKRQDGYHELTSVMQSVSLCDLLTIKLSDGSGKISFSCSDFSLTGADNLAFRAAKLYLDTFNIQADISLSLEKHIPTGAGLGGGSSDAAAVLRLLHNSFCACGKDTITALAASLGADVPFCLEGGTQLAHGIGDILSPLPAIPDCYFLIVKSCETIPTPYAYGLLDRYNNTDPAPGCDSLLSAVAVKDFRRFSASLYNSFEKIILPLCPDALRAERILSDMGADAVLMSGSGPSVFGIFAAQPPEFEADAGAFSSFICKPCGNEVLL